MESKQKSVPAHNLYEDGWKFCTSCQRFHYTKEDICPIHGTGFRTDSKGNKNQPSKRIMGEGLGLPVWSYFIEFKDGPEGKLAIDRFIRVRDSLIEKIESAPPDRKIALKELGATEFENHWFIKKVREDDATRPFSDPYASRRGEVSTVRIQKIDRDTDGYIERRNKRRMKNHQGKTINGEADGYPDGGGFI